MSTTTHTDPDARIVPLSAIQIADGANPRRHFDQDKLAELAESIRTHGILQPLVVYDDQANGGYVLIAGERRHRAASLAGLTSVPVIVRDDGEEMIELATDENLHRQDLNPIEEAAAFQTILESGKLTRAKLAERVSKSSQYVSERLRLLDLPETVQEAIATGSIPVRLGKLFAKIAKVSEPVASACATLISNGHVELSEVEQHPERVIGRLGDFTWPEPQPVAVAISSYGRYPLDSLGLPADMLAEISERAAELGVEGFGFDRADADAARAYGSLLEFKHDRHWVSEFITDPAFIADRIRLVLDEHEKRQQERESREAEANPQVDDAEQRSLDERRARRQEENADRELARQANFELGRKLLGRYDTVKLSKPVAQLLVQLVLADDAAGLAARGLGLANEDWQVVEERPLKRGGTKTVSRPPSPGEAEQLLNGWIERARTPEQILGRLVQALIAAQHADASALPQSRRPRYTLPGTWGDGPTAQIPTLVERLAKSVLPKRLAEQQRERTELRQSYGHWEGRHSIEAAATETKAA